MTIAYTPRTETVVILQGDDEEQLRHLRAYRDSLKSDPRKPAQTTLLAQNPQAEYEEAKEAAAAFAEEATKRGITVVLRSVGRKTWRELVAAHPPRDDNDADDVRGVNIETFGRAIIAACMGSPVLSADELDELLDSITEADYGNLENTAWLLNTGRSSDPKAELASRPTRT
jgi:hypothetical protein